MTRLDQEIKNRLNLQEELRINQGDQRRLKSMIEMLESMNGLAEDRVPLTPVRSSKVAEMVEAVKNKKVDYHIQGTSKIDLPSYIIETDCPVILVHEYYADKLAIHPDDEVHMPFEKCYFEFAYKLNDINTRVILYYEDDQVVFCAIYAQRDKQSSWCLFDYPMTMFVNDVRSACVLLESEVIEKEVERIPAKLNRAREKRGTHPLNDFHVLKIKPRIDYNPSDIEHDGPQRSSPRLHIRRGHWRHYPNHRTWIKWQVVGDAERGKIDKTYSIDF